MSFCTKVNKPAGSCGSLCRGLWTPPLPIIWRVDPAERALGSLQVLFLILFSLLGQEK